MKTPKLIFVSLAAVVLLLWVVVFALSSMPRGEAQRYAELHQHGRDYLNAWSVGPSVSERLTALAHFSSATNYYYHRLESDVQSLVASGYLVETALPVPNLQSKWRRIALCFSNTAIANGAYYEAKFDTGMNEVRLLCRKEDMPLWQRAMKDSQ